MTKYFNTLLSLNDITICYKTNNFPNAHCLLWNQEQGVELLANENGKYVTTQTRKGMVIERGTTATIFENQ